MASGVVLRRRRGLRRRISNRGDCLSDPRHTPRPSRDFFIVFFAFIWRISGKQPSVCGFEASPSASKRAPLSPLDSLLSNYPEDVSHDDHLIAMVTPASSPMCIRNGGREAVGIIIRAALYVRVRVRACAIASDECQRCGHVAFDLARSFLVVISSEAMSMS